MYFSRNLLAEYIIIVQQQHPSFCKFKKYLHTYLYYCGLCCSSLKYFSLSLVLKRSPVSMVMSKILNLKIVLLILSTNSFLLKEARHFGSRSIVTAKCKISSNVDGTQNCSKLCTNFQDYTNHVSSKAPTETELILLLFILAFMVLMYVHLG